MLKAFFSAMLSPLTWRVLTVNVLALGVLVAGLLFLGQYEEELVEAETEALKTQAEIFAGALGEGAVGTDDNGAQAILAPIARPMLRRLVEPTRARARLFGPGGVLIADSRALAGPGQGVEEEPLPPPGQGGVLDAVWRDVYEWGQRLLSSGKRPQTYVERAVERASDYAEAVGALNGESRVNIRYDRADRMVLIVAVPVQHFKQVLGALMLSVSGKEIETRLRDVRLEVLKVFGIALSVTVILSFYLAGAIARPVRRLAQAARGVRVGRSEISQIPDFTARRDEIGDLSGALRDMTADLWTRMGAVESFAADVAHEIKNPLTSLRSAVETALRVKNPDQQRALMAIVEQDVKRLDRLISDISSASRLDVELARSAMEDVDIARLLQTLVDIHDSTGAGCRRPLALALEVDAPIVKGIETRLVQVFQNLLSNAFSFSPEGAAVHIRIARRNGAYAISVEDGGPGIPEENLDSVFQRFYTQRPEAEDFGTHSGLGLSISRQIVSAHGGTISAMNRYGEDGEIAGARFTVILPPAR